MKLATRISSMFRHVKKAWRSCSPASDSKWADSPARRRLAAGTASPPDDRARDGGVGGFGEGDGANPVLRPVDQQRGNPDTGQEVGQGRPAAGLVHGRDEDLGRGLQATGGRILPRLGRVRLDERLSEEELQEVPEVLTPVMGIELLPSLVSVTRP